MAPLGRLIGCAAALVTMLHCQGARLRCQLTPCVSPGAPTGAMSPTDMGKQKPDLRMSACIAGAGSMGAHSASDSRQVPCKPVDNRLSSIYTT